MKVEQAFEQSRSIEQGVDEVKEIPQGSDIEPNALGIPEAMNKREQQNRDGKKAAFPKQTTLPSHSLNEKASDSIEKRSDCPHLLHIFSSLPPALFIFSSVKRASSPSNASLKSPLESADARFILEEPTMAGGEWQESHAGRD